MLHHDGPRHLIKIWLTGSLSHQKRELLLVAPYTALHKIWRDDGVHSRICLIANLDKSTIENGLENQTSSEKEMKKLTAKLKVRADITFRLYGSLEF